MCYFLGIQLEVIRSGLGIERSQLRVQRCDQTTADGGGELGPSNGDFLYELSLPGSSLMEAE
jgi:hypothetical protein